MTKSGVERDLRRSPYVTNLMYGNKNVTFCFSSATCKMRFDEAIESNRKEIRESLTARFKIEFKVANEFCDITLYRKIERRGFLICMEGVEVKWLGELTYNGIEVIKKS